MPVCKRCHKVFAAQTVGEWRSGVCPSCASDAGLADKHITGERKTDIPTTDIGWAIRGLKLGKKVRRRGWHDKSKFLWSTLPVKIQAEWCRDPTLRKLAEDKGGTVEVPGAICVYLEVDGVPTVLTEWHPTPCDLLAEDWEEVGE